MDRLTSETSAGPAAAGGDGLTLPGPRAMAAGVLRGPVRWFRPETWRACGQLALWLLMSFTAVTVTLLGLLASLLTSRDARLLTRTRRAVRRGLARTVEADLRRIAHFSGVRIRPLAVRQLAGERAAHELPWRSRLAGYELASATVAGGLIAAAVGWWWATIACAAKFLGPEPYYRERLIDVFGVRIGPSKLLTVDDLLLALGAILGILAWPTVVRVVPVIDAALARRLLGPGQSELTDEVERLAETRAQAVAAADAERRRIERDLHDGFQPQLVNLALNLGLARSRLADDPDGARELIDRAHDDAKRATADLRNLVRGIHPSVLDERGLDAAFSALAASSAVPLQIDIHLDRRPSREAEGIAYFVVAEAITNVNKHARAHRATVTITEIDDVLRVLVQDDGRGGAAIETGGGLAGLGARVAGVDGAFSVASPNGGPTWIEARIPCAR